MKRLFPFILLAISGLGVHLWSLLNLFYLDDLPILRDNAWLNDSHPFAWYGRFFADSFRMFPSYRPTLMMSFWANEHFLGDSPASFRVINILLHILNALLVYHIVLRLRRPSSLWLALGTALFFLLHPIQTLAMNMIWKRSSVLEATFMLSSLLLHVKQREEGHYPVDKIALQILLALFALTTKESAVVLPLLLISVDFLFFRNVLRVGKNWIPTLLVSGTAIFFIWFRLGPYETLMSRQIVYFPTQDMLSLKDYLYTSLTVIPRYVGLWIVPAPLLVDDPLPITIFPWLGALLTGLLLIASFFLTWKKRKDGWVALSVILFWVGLAPTLFHSLRLTMDQIRLYLPLIGLSYFLSAGLAAASAKFPRLPPWVVIACISVAYGASSVAQHLRYRNPLVVWADVVDAYPRSTFAWKNFGSILDATAQYEDASKAYQQAFELDPSTTAYFVNSLWSRTQAGERSAAIRKSLENISISTLDARGRTKLAEAFVIIDEASRAESVALAVIQENYTFGPAHLLVAGLWEKAGKLDEARRAYANSLALMPKNRKAIEGIERLGRPVQ